MRCRLHQDRQGTRRTEVTARPATQPDPARPGHSSAPMNLHPHRELRSRRTNRPRPPHLRQPGFFIPALSCPVHTPLFSHLIPPLFHNGSISCISLPLRHVFPTVPLLQPPCATFSFRHLSTTAAISAILCRCGMSFPLFPYYSPPAPHSPFATFPQRHHFPHFAAVAAWPFSRHPCCRPSGPHCHPVTLPQRQHFSRFSAVVALTFSPTPATGLPDGIAILLRFGR